MASSKSLEHQKLTWQNLYLMMCSHDSEITMVYDIQMCKQTTGRTEMASSYSGTLYHGCYYVN